MNPTYDKLLELAAEAYHERARLTYGREPKDTWPHDWFVGETRIILDAIWPEIERREHHYNMTLARLAVKLRALSEDAEAQIL